MFYFIDIESRKGGRVDIFILKWFNFSLMVNK